MSPNALIFDLDGTLVDTNHLHARAWRDAFAEAGFDVSEERIVEQIGKGGEKLVAALLGEDVARERAEDLEAAHGERFMERVEAEEVPVFPDVQALFEALHARGLKAAVATASKQKHLDRVLERAGLGLKTWADALVTDSDVEHSKPHPDTVTAAVRKLDLEAAQCAMVADTPYDAEACRRAGVTCLGGLTGVHPAEVLREAGAVACYADTGDLLAHLDEALAAAARGQEAPARDY